MITSRKILLAASLCIVSTSLFAQTKKIEKKRVSQKANSEDTVIEVFNITQKAIFPDGEYGLQRFISENLKYPELALKNKTQGTVHVMFVVDVNGRVKDAVIIGEPQSDGLDEEAIRIVKSTSGMWTPAKQGNKPVDMRFRIPIDFRL